MKKDINSSWEIDVYKRQIYKRLYLRLGKVAPIHAFGRVDIPGKGVERQDVYKRQLLIFCKEKFYGKGIKNLLSVGK